MALDTAGERHGAFSQVNWVAGPLQDSTALRFSPYSVFVAPALPLDPPVTFAAWVFQEALGLNPVIRLEDSARFASQYGLGCWIDRDGRPRVTAGDGRAGELYMAHWLGQSALPVGQWVHLACRIDGDKAVTFFVDGQPGPGPAEEGREPGPLAHDPWTTATIGYTVEGEVLSGSLDDVRVYARALSVQEIEALYQQGSDGSGAYGNAM